jgi:hypothetical protein
MFNCSLQTRIFHFCLIFIHNLESVYSVPNSLFQGQVWIRQKWDAAGLKWTDFLPADKVGEFVKQNVSCGQSICYVEKSYDRSNITLVSTRFGVCGGQSFHVRSAAHIRTTSYFNRIW